MFLSGNGKSGSHPSFSALSFVFTTSDVIVRTRNAHAMAYAATMECYKIREVSTQARIRYHDAKSELEKLTGLKLDRGKYQNDTLTLAELAAFDTYDENGPCLTDSSGRMLMVFVDQDDVNFAQRRIGITNPSTFKKNDMFVIPQRMLIVREFLALPNLKYLYLRALQYSIYKDDPEINLERERWIHEKTEAIGLKSLDLITDLFERNSLEDKIRNDRYYSNS